MAENIASSEVVFVLKSTWYPDFRQKILTLLSLPNGMDMTIEYDDMYFAEAIKTNLQRYKGKTSCVIFVDYASNVPKFYPIRICEIVGIIAPIDGITYQLILRTGDFIVPSDLENFSSKVHEFLEQQKAISLDAQGRELVSHLVLRGDQSILNMAKADSNQQKLWEGIIGNLVNLDGIQRLENQPQFAESIFFRWKVLPRHELRSPVIPKDGAHILDQGSQYCLMLSVYNPHLKNFKANSFKELIIDFDSRLISHVGSERLDLPQRQKKYTKYFDFLTKEPIVSGRSQLLIRGEKDDFNTPYVTIPIVLHTRKMEIIGILGCLVLGLFILGAASTLSGVIASVISNTEAEPQVEVALSVIGTILSALPIAWLEIKGRIS